MQQVLAYRLRPPLASEYEELFAIHRESMADYVRATWGLWVDGVQREFFDARMAGGIIQVIDVDGECAGLFEVEDTNYALFLVNLQVAARFRRQGIGSSIIREEMSRATRRGMPLELTVLRVNPARALYERLGFVEYRGSNTHHYMRWTPSGLLAGGTSE